MTTTQQRQDAIHEVSEQYFLDDFAFTAYCDNHHITEKYEDEVTNFQESYVGYYDTFLVFAETVFDDTMAVPDHLMYYIDYEKFARDLKHEYWTHEDEYGNLYIFRDI